MAGEKGAIDSIVGSLGKAIPLVNEFQQAWGTAAGGITDVLKGIESSSEIIETYRIKLTQASGATAKFAEQLKTEVKALNEYGVTYNKLVDANVAIAESYSKATFSAAQTREAFEADRKKIQELVTINDRFGISQKETIDLANKLGNSVFNNVEQVSKFSDTLLKFSRETGQPFSNVLREFGSYSDRFVMAISSDKAIQAFTTLELMARRSGSSVDKLVGAIGKFDDIDEAFSSGGQINRVLSYFGGSLDTLAMANASDEEKAKMLMESISGIADQFNAQMTDPNARRSVLKELTKQTGLDVNTITGLLNKNNDLSKDLQSIIRTPVVTGMATIPAEEKKKMAMDVTTSKEVKEIAKENVMIGPITFALERMITNQKGALLKVGSDVAGRVDSAVAQFLKTGDTSAFLTQFGKSIGPIIDKIGDSSKTGTIIGEFGAVITSSKSLGAAFQGLTGETAGGKIAIRNNEQIAQLHKTDQANRAAEAKALADAVAAGAAKGIENSRIKVESSATVKVEGGGRFSQSDMTSIVTQQTPALPK